LTRSQALHGEGQQTGGGSRASRDRRTSAKADKRALSIRPVPERISRSSDHRMTQASGRKWPTTAGENGVGTNAGFAYFAGKCFGGCDENALVIHRRHSSPN